MQSRANWLSSKPVWSVLGSGAGSWLIHKSGHIKGMPEQPNLRFSSKCGIDSFRSDSTVDYWGFPNEAAGLWRYRPAGSKVQHENLRGRREWETLFPSWTNSCQRIFKPPIAAVENWRGKKEGEKKWVTPRCAPPQYEEVIGFYWHTFHQTTRYNAAWNKCTTLLTFRQLVAPEPVKIFQEDFQVHEFGSASVWLLLLLPNVGITLSNLFFFFKRRQHIWMYLLERRVQVWKRGEETLAWSLLVCQQTDGDSLFRNILAFLQRTPIPNRLHVSEK